MILIFIWETYIHEIACLHDLTLLFIIFGTLKKASFPCFVKPVNDFEWTVNNDIICAKFKYIVNSAVFKNIAYL